MLCRFCSSKYTSTLSSRSIRVILRQSSVFRAKRLMDLTMIMSTLPRLHWRMSLLNSSRFFILVPVIPLSA